MKTARSGFFIGVNMIGMNGDTGKHLTGNAHLKQSIEDILTTPIGTRVLLRDYGSTLFNLVDSPQDDSTRVRIVQAAATAIIKWEPRITLKKIIVSFVGKGQFWLTLIGINNETRETIRLEGIAVVYSAGDD